MRPPSENFRNKLSTFHSTSVGGRFVGLLKKISYSILSRRSCESRRFSSSSVVTGFSSPQSRRCGARERGIRWSPRSWYESKGGCCQLSAVSHQFDPSSGLQPYLDLNKRTRFLG